MEVDLPYRAPIAWERLIAFLAARAAPSVEAADGDAYARTVCIDGHAGVIRVARSTNAGADAPALMLQMTPSLGPVADRVVTRTRQLFDLDADTNAIEAHLAAAELAPRERLRPGLRVPGAFDPFELAVRAVLGQQVSVAGASTLMSRFTAKFGEAIETGHASLTHLAATAERIANGTVEDIRSIGLPAVRAATIQRLACAVAQEKILIAPGADPSVVMEQLCEIPGIGPWTSGYIAMRALRWPDAFPASDLVLRRNAGAATPRELLQQAERWRPWRAYAAMQLWSGINDSA
jgi:AraC family transcriptional regulator, regulatory protein of adaptative response / DNA-3-methyladenine glycosylase II